MRQRTTSSSTLKDNASWLQFQKHADQANVCQVQNLRPVIQHPSPQLWSWSEQIKRTDMLPCLSGIHCTSKPFANPILKSQMPMHSPISHCPCLCVIRARHKLNHMIWIVLNIDGSHDLWRHISNHQVIFANAWMLCRFKALPSGQHLEADVPSAACRF